MKVFTVFKQKKGHKVQGYTLKPDGVVADETGILTQGLTAIIEEFVTRRGYTFMPACEEDDPDMVGVFV